MKKLLLAGIAALSLVTGTAHAQTSGTLTLVCQGMMQSMETKTGKVTEAPISIGVVVNFATQTVEGFGPPIKIFVNQTTIGFDKFDRWPNPSERTMGTIDRVTGEASVFFADKIISGCGADTDQQADARQVRRSD